MVRRLSLCLGFSLFLGRIPEAVQEHRVPPSYIGFGEGEVFPELGQGSMGPVCLTIPSFPSTSPSTPQSSSGGVPLYLSYIPIR
jgi:hypothetical protein